MSAVVVIIEEDEAYRQKLKTFLMERFGTKWETADMKKPYFIMQHDTEAPQLWQALIKAGLHAELVQPQK
jgi:hypothetical protein